MGRFDELTRLVDDLNARFNALGTEADLLPPTSLPLQSDDVPEAGFLRLVSWLWSRYYETGRVTLEALMSLSSVSLTSNSTAHLRASEFLRTQMQHHLDAASADDRRKDELATDWLVTCCGRFPNGPNDWNSAVQELCKDAEALVRDLVGIVDELTSAELADEFKHILQVRLERTVPPHEVDGMIEELKPLYGLDHLDTRAFRDRHYQRWRERTRLLAADRDPRTYVRDLIEQALAHYIQADPAPLTGDEIMDVFGLRPGPDVGKLKRRTEELAAGGLRTKRELIEVLADEFRLAPRIDPTIL